MNSDEVEVLLRTLTPCAPPSTMDRRVLEAAARKLRKNRRPGARAGGFFAFAAALLFCVAVAGWLSSFRPTSKGLLPEARQEGARGEELERLIRLLASDDVDVREKASRDLRDRAIQDPSLADALESRLAKEIDPESRMRMGKVVDEIRDGRLLRLKIVPQGMLSNQGRQFGRAEFSPDGKLLATMSWEGSAQKLRLWDVKECRELQAVDIGPGEFSETLRFLPDGSEILVAGNGLSFYPTGNLRSFHTEPFTTVRGRSLPGIALRPGDGKTYAYSGYSAVEGKMRQDVLVLATLDGREAARRTFGAKTVGARYLRWSPDGSYLLTDVAQRGLPPELAMLRGDTLETLAAVHREDPQQGRDMDLWINDAAVSSDGKYVVTQSNGSLCVWDAPSLTLRASLPGLAKGGEFSPYGTWMVGRRIVSWGAGGKAIVVAAFSPRKTAITLLHTIDRGGICPTALSRDGRWMAYSPSTDGTTLAIVRLDED